MRRDHAKAAERTCGGGIADSLTESSTEVTLCQELLTSDSNARSIGMTKAEKLQRLKGLREGAIRTSCGKAKRFEGERSFDSLRSLRMTILIG